MRFIETPIFTRRVCNLISEESYRVVAMENTDQYPFQGSPGGSQMNKEDFNELITSVKQAGKIKRGKMRASRQFEYAPADIKAIRKRLEKSQSEFALMIGVSVSTLQNWEQGRRRPEGPARALLKIATENPQAVSEALGA